MDFRIPNLIQPMLAAWHMWHMIQIGFWWPCRQLSATWRRMMAWKNGWKKGQQIFYLFQSSSSRQWVFVSFPVSCSLFQAQDIHLSDGDGAEDRPARTKKRGVFLGQFWGMQSCAVRFFLYFILYTYCMTCIFWLLTGVFQANVEKLLQCRIRYINIAFLGCARSSFSSSDWVFHSFFCFFLARSPCCSVGRISKADLFAMSFSCKSAFALLNLSVCLAVQCVYPGGECYELKLQKCEGMENWTLHGLWPEWQNECEGPDFDMDALKDIHDEMESKWPSCPEYGQSEEEFWSHEWTKHGTCSGMGQLQYFKKALQMHDEYMEKCPEGNQCAICFSKNLTSQETCPNADLEDLKVLV